MNDQPTRITSQENCGVKGLAKIGKHVLDDHTDKLARLRQRQEQYEATLPKEPLEALKEINSALDDLNDMDHPAYAARAALTIAHEFAMQGGLGESKDVTEALFWLTSQGLNGLNTIVEGTKRATDIAHQFFPLHEPFKA